MPIRKSARKRALIAIAFAGGLLNSQQPALSANKSDSTDSATRRGESPQLTPELSAFYSLKLANSYLVEGDGDALKSRSSNLIGDPLKIRPKRRKASMDFILVSWANQISLETASSNRNSNEKSALADEEIRKALVQLDQSSETYEKLNMYFIASRLFQKSGNTRGIQDCNAVLNQAFDLSENAPIDEERIRAASSILNSMAYGGVPVTVPDNPNQQPTQVKTFTEQDFEESKKLKLRALKMVDRLAASNHVRRKTHRDLVLWYMQLGKTEMAEREKQVLFELVGFKDESILYPQSGGCGSVVWWKKQFPTREFADCGMG